MNMGLRDVTIHFILNDANFSTYDRGTAILDAIFASGDIKGKSAGYLPFGK
jgi:hypothetical protein